MVLITRKMLRLLKPEDIEQAMKWGRLERRAAKLRVALSAIEQAMKELDGSPVSVKVRSPQNSTESKGKPAPVRRKRKPLSRATRLKMALSARLRWKKIKEAKAEPAKDAAGK